MAGLFKALTCAQEPRCSRQDNPAFAACPHGSLSSPMAVPHSASRRRKAAASPVLALLAASKVLMDAAVGPGAVGAVAAAAGPGAAAPAAMVRAGSAACPTVAGSAALPGFVAAWRG